MRKTVLTLIAALCCVGLSPLSAEIDLEAERAALAAYQQRDQQLQDVGWRLVEGNAAFCDDAIPSVGMQLQDLKSYGRPEVARAALGLQRDFAIQTAARGSPSQGLTGQVSTREIAAIDGVDPSAWPAEERLHWQRLTKAHDFIDQQLQTTGMLQLTFANGASTTLEPVVVCRSRFEIMSGSRRAVADGSRVIFGIEFRGFDYDEPLFASAVAHELAHNLLKHRIWLNTNKRKRKHVRLTEREADRLMPWLIANAGYDPAAALEFMNVWGPRHDAGIFRKRTHDGWDERADLIAAELPIVRALMAQTGKADWSKHFRREIDPSGPPPR